MKLLKRLLKVFTAFVVLLVAVTFFFMQQKPFGKLPSGIRLGKIKSSPHYKKEGFENLISTPMLAENTSYWSMMFKFFGSVKGRTPAAALPFIKTDLQRLPVSGKPRITWFGHSTYLISLNGKNILVDPVFSRRASPVQYAGMKSYEGTNEYAAADMPDIDLVVISHDHYDHLDYNSIVHLAAKTKKFCTPLGVGEHLVHWGIDNTKITELDWWQSNDILAGIEIIATPARHFSGRGFTRNKTLWASFVIRTADYRLFIGGDSGYDDSFKQIGKKYGPFDIAMLECGQYDVQWPYVHMMPEETVQASIDLQARVLMPVHWGKFTLALHPWKEPVERLTRKAKSLGVQTVTPVIGQPFAVAATSPENPWWNKVD
jgi:L-ascorbate metabolism protein UlaG (beta-lactamase superfamily)